MSRKIIKFSLFIAMMILVACSNATKTPETLKSGTYHLGSVSFQKETTTQEQIDYINDFKPITVEDNKLILTEDSIIEYSLKNGYITIRKGGVSQKYECEDFSTNEHYSYELFINSKTIKSIRITATPVQ